MKNLAPTIFRQRMVIEALLESPITDQNLIDDYLVNLSDVLDMKIVQKPLTRHNPKYGFSSYVYWEESGTHFYSWDEPAFMSVDIYTCKKFDPEDALRVTRQFFTIKELEFKQI